MALEDEDYYSVLMQALGGIDRDSYAARGVVYEREHKALMRRLYSADPPFSDAEIDSEKKRFRDAIHRIEFGEGDYQITLIPDRDTLAEQAARRPAMLAAPPRRKVNGGEPESIRAWRQPEPVVELKPARQRMFSGANRWSKGKSPKSSPPLAPDGPEPDRSGVDRSASDRPASDRPGPGKAVPEKTVQDNRPVEGKPVPALHWSLRNPYPEQPNRAQGNPRQQKAPGLTLEAALGEAIKDGPVAGISKRPAVAAAPERPAPKQPRRSVTGRVLMRTLPAALLVFGVILGSAYVNDDLNVTKLTSLVGQMSDMGDASSSEQRAILYDDNPPDPTGPRIVGSAVWRAQLEPSGVQLKPTKVLHLKVEVPQRRLAMTMTFRPETAGAAMSHLAEIRFLREDQQPDGDISTITGLVMTGADLARPASLIGSVVRVTPGVFLFGLSAKPEDVEKNLRSLKEGGWFGIPLTYRNGVKGVLTFEKGSAAEHMLTEVLAQSGV
jgi:hypothetical protein